MSDEIAELEEFFKLPEYRGIIATVLGRNGCNTIRALFDAQPDLCFELHDNLCDMRTELREVDAAMEKAVEREVM